MAVAVFENVYGLPPAELVDVAADAAQFSPLIPGAHDLDTVAHATLNGLAMLAPSAAVERRYTLARALRALRPGAPLVVLAPKNKGGSRIAQDLRELGCAFDESARRHHRICSTTGPGDDAAIAAALAAGEAQFMADIGLWSQPGVFSWNRIDPGSALLMAQLLAHRPALAGRGADFGCGIGVLSRAVLVSPAVTHLTLIDIDRRALAMACRNLQNIIDETRITPRWADARTLNDLSGLDFVVMNPPFHEGGIENQALGQNFIQRAALALRAGGVCWLTANRHLPYEAILKPLFRRVTLVVEADGYKVYQAQK
jgi:16S rRNA (guanine1207-N2)-methyltransferase